MDTVRWDHTGLSGYTKNPTTPHLDEFAKNSYVFEKAYTSLSNQQLCLHQHADQPRPLGPHPCMAIAAS